MVKSTNHEAPHAVFPSTLTRPSQTQIFSLPCYRKRSAYALVLMSDVKFHTHTAGKTIYMVSGFCIYHMRIIVFQETLLERNVRV